MSNKFAKIVCVIMKECIICHYQYFLDKDFKFKPYVYKDCQDMLMISFGINNIVFPDIYDIDYHCIIFGGSWKKQSHVNDGNLEMVIKTINLKRLISIIMQIIMFMI